MGPVDEGGLAGLAGPGQPDAERGPVADGRVSDPVEREGDEFGEGGWFAGMDLYDPGVGVGFEPPAEPADGQAGFLHSRVHLGRLVGDAPVEKHLPSAVLQGTDPEVPVVQAEFGGDLGAGRGLRVRQLFEERLALVWVEHGEPVSGVFGLVHGLHLGALAGFGVFGAQVDFEAGIVAHVDAGSLPVDEDGDVPVPVDEFEAGGLGFRMRGPPFVQLAFQQAAVGAVVGGVELDGFARFGLHPGRVLVFESDHAGRLCERTRVTHTGAYGKRLR